MAKFFDLVDDELGLLKLEDLQALPTSELVVGIAALVSTKIITQVMVEPGSPFEDVNAASEVEKAIDANLALIQPELDQRLALIVADSSSAAPSRSPATVADLKARLGLGLGPKKKG